MAIMKKIIFTLTFAALAAAAIPACAQAPQKAAGKEAAKKVKKNAPKFEFAGGDTYDFGSLSDQRDAECTFVFKNTGKTPLIIERADVTCGCTEPEVPTEPVMPGMEGKIKVTYRTTDKAGPFSNTIWIKSNAPSNVSGDRYEIYIRGSVLPGASIGNNMRSPAKG